MKWKYRKYMVWVINTKTEPSLYLWDNWKLLFPALDILISLTKEQAFIRTFQSYKYENRWLGFGRMKWNEENNIKWTTKYRNGNIENKLPDFSHTEIWAPDWNRVCDESMPPDVFVQLYYFPTLENIREGLVIAIPKSLYKRNIILVDSALTNLMNDISGSTISTSTRSWWSGWKTSNEIGDIGNQEIEKIVKG